MIDLPEPRTRSVAAVMLSLSRMAAAFPDHSSAHVMHEALQLIDALDEKCTLLEQELLDRIKNNVSVA